MGDHATVYYAADLVAFYGDKVLLIDRKYEPYGKAFAGGHVDADETSRQAAAREAWEETGLPVDPDDLRMVGVYDKPDRDPRRRTVSVVYLVELDEEPAVNGADDATTAAWYPIDGVLSGLHGDLAFDHRQILSDALGIRDRI